MQVIVKPTNQVATLSLIDIKPTNQVATLSLIDSKTGVDYVADYIGNTGAFDREFSQVGDDWYISQDDYDWWVDVIAKQQASNDLQAEYLETHSSDELFDLLSQITACDLDDIVNQELELLQSVCAR